MPSEFELIRRHFSPATGHTVLAGGDDGAVIRPRPGMDVVISTDMLVCGSHFLPDVAPEDLGWKALAVNLSDLAAMGAEPRWAVVALSLPAADEDWVAGFARGLFALAAEFDVDVIGGDTTRGPLNIAPTVFGELPRGSALTRAGARAGDDIWVSGVPGRAALGLAHLQGRIGLDEAARGECVGALLRPRPRIALGLALRAIASAAIDVSDGLLADLGHVLERSEVAAELDAAQLPHCAEGLDAEMERDCQLAGGDDYELLFTAAAQRRAEIEALAARLALPLTCIGRITPGRAGELRLAAGAAPARRGYDHFA